jgi:hypothetical protein
MRKTRLLLADLTLFVIALSFLACGNRQLKTLSISPATASGQVQFAAMGTYSGSSQSAAVGALWWTNLPWTYPPSAFIISISSTGQAQCTGIGPPGTYPIWAVAPVDPSVPLSKVSMTTKQLVATAQLTCP